MTQQQIADAMLSTKFLLGSIIVDTLSTIVGGYVAARIARREPYINSGAIGVLGIVLGVIVATHYPLWFNVLKFVLVLPAALLGGYLAKSRTGTMTKNVLIALWLLFSIAWSAFIAFLLFIVTAVPAHVSGGLSPFFLYWLGPIVVPLVIYKIIKIYGVRTKNTENKEWPVATNNESDENA